MTIDRNLLGYIFDYIDFSGDDFLSSTEFWGCHPQGLYEIGYQAVQKASYMKQQLLENNFKISNLNNSLREFIVQTSKPSEEVILNMGSKGFLAGIKYSDNEILVAVTEKRTKDEIDSYVSSLQEVDNA